MNEFGYVLATKKLVEEKLPVMFMYRENSKGGDSGWRFFAGIEDQEYVDDPNNIGIYDIKTITDIDGSIISYLNSSVGVAFEREICTEDFREAKDFNFSPECIEV